MNILKDILKGKYITPWSELQTSQRIVLVCLPVFYLLLTLLAIFLISGRKHDTASQLTEKKTEQKASIDTTAIIESIQTHSRLYTAEATSRKTITYTSQNKLSLRLGSKQKDIALPLGKTTARIPVAVTYKAYIDLSKVTHDNVQLQGDSIIRIVLPDPVIVETAVAIDHDTEKLERQLLGKGLSPEQYQQLVVKAKDDAWREMSEKDQRAIVETAKVSATELITPTLHNLGFRHVEIAYRKDFSLRELLRLKD